MESGGKGIPGVKVLLLKGSKEKGGDPLEKVREFAARAGEIRDKLERAGPGLSAERIAAYKQAFLSRLKLQIAGSARSGKGGRFRFAQVVLPRGDKEFLALEAEPPKGLLAPDPVMVEPSFLGPGKGPDLVLLRPARVKGMVLAWPGGGRAGMVAAWRIGKGKVLERRGRYYFSTGSAAFELKDLRPGKWRLVLFSRMGRIFFSWGPVLDLGEGDFREGIVLRGDTPSSLEVFVYGPGKSPLGLDARVILTLLSAGPPGGEGEDAALERSFLPAVVRGGRPARTSLLSPWNDRITAEIGDMIAPRFSFAPRKKEEKNPYRVEKVVLLKPGPNQVDLVFPKLPPRLDLHVRVKDPSGRPLGEGMVRIWPRYQWGVAGKSKEARLGPGGRAFLEGLNPAKFRIKISSPGFWSADEELDLSGSRDPVVVREYTLHKAGRIEGAVLDAEGKPAAGRRLSIIREREGGTGRSRPVFFPRFFVTAAGKDGRFSRDVPQGKYSFRFLGTRDKVKGKVVMVHWGETVKVELRIPP